jgi:hypothetical protein
VPNLGLPPYAAETVAHAPLQIFSKCHFWHLANFLQYFAAMEVTNFKWLTKILSKSLREFWGLSLLALNLFRRQHPLEKESH